MHGRKRKAKNNAQGGYRSVLLTHNFPRAVVRPRQPTQPTHPTPLPKTIGSIPIHSAQHTKDGPRSLCCRLQRHRRGLGPSIWAYRRSAPKLHRSHERRRAAKEGKKGDEASCLLAAPRTRAPAIRAALIAGPQTPSALDSGRFWPVEWVDHLGRDRMPGLVLGFQVAIAHLTPGPRGHQHDSQFFVVGG